ncbi:hypothetical protein [Peribacillus kribbensis]|uniref:hypothetical protein n=1 Tax=Peribacillus kribbensis TaxID=356658 RepID=UPI000414D0B3|nr:hypothetical protein [Peribacillus kribbensis]
MKKMGMILLAVWLLTGCSSNLHTGISIDWVDFIVWDGEEYDGMFTGALADPAYVGRELGKVKFKVAEKVYDPEYKTKNGDAAFLEKGTRLYSVKGRPDLIAVPSQDSIKGYKLYGSSDTPYKLNFKDIPIDKVRKIEIYKTSMTERAELLSTMENRNKMNQLYQLLSSSKEDSSFQPDSAEKDSVQYKLIFYTGDPVAIQFDLDFDGKTYYWFPEDISIVPQEIDGFIRAK